MTNNAARAALAWYLDNGVDEALEDSPQDRTRLPPPPAKASPPPPAVTEPMSRPAGGDLLGAHDARAEAIRLARAANTLEELAEAIRAFDGLAIRKTATNMVFADGNPAAPIMLVGEAPGADEDRLGRPFVGVSGQLLDRILASIGLSRSAENLAQAVYISNILNWRPPGNRTPSPAEIEISRPFIERHIALVQPKLLILCGGVAAKALLSSEDGVSKLRRKWHAYTPAIPDIAEIHAIPAIATYHPSYLLRTPSQKKAVWQDMISVAKKREDLGITGA